MATPRLSFLWPFLFKPTGPGLKHHATQYARRGVQTTSRRRQQTVNQRYGTANEPPPHFTTKSGPPATTNQSGGKETKAVTKTNGKNAKATKEGPVEEMLDKESIVADEATAIPTIEESPTSKQKASAKAKKTVGTVAQELGALDLEGLDMPVTPAPPTPQLPSKKPMETVLNMPSSDELETAQAPMHQQDRLTPSDTPDEHRPPHISTPPYVHHFDSYSLVKRLVEGGWDQRQAIATMKAVRLILADNMELAREGLVSKSNVENETYLFKAACSELRTEINTRRKTEGERSRTERAQLQHEVDILNQRFTQNGMNLKDELKGMFDDRKMVVRNEQRSMESKIQELNYLITVSLNSDSRSDVEGVRWVITKRAITAIFVCVLMTLSSLKYASTMQQLQEEDRKRVKAMASAGTQRSHSEGTRDAGTDPWNGPSSEQRNKEESLGGGEMLVMEKGDNPAFVSLG